MSTRRKRRRDLEFEIDWSRTHPCNDCPFTRSAPFHSGVAKSVPALLLAIRKHEAAHTCHKTDNRPNCDGPRNYPGKTQHCAGLILMLMKTGEGADLQIPLLYAAEDGELDLHKMMEIAKRSPDVFTLGEMVQFYIEELEKTRMAWEAGDP